MHVGHGHDSPGPQEREGVREAQIRHSGAMFIAVLVQNGYGLVFIS